MTKDEQAIRDLIDTWMRASAAGDTKRALSLMAEDVVFLTPGRPPIRGRDEFAALAAGNPPSMKGQSEVVEVMVHGDWAHAWTRLTVTVEPAGGGPTIRRSGNTLSIFKKKPDGSWVLARDANMLAPEAAERQTPVFGGPAPVGS